MGCIYGHKQLWQDKRRACIPDCHRRIDVERKFCPNSDLEIRDDCDRGLQRHSSPEIQMHPLIGIDPKLGNQMLAGAYMSKYPFAVYDEMCGCLVLRN